MEQKKIYQAARDILRIIADIPSDKFLFGEQLFLFRHCMRFSDGSINIIADFGEEELKMLTDIAQAVIARTYQTVH